MERKEALGPAETILQTLLSYNDPMVHNRPGTTVRDTKSTVGVRWLPVTHAVEGADKVVYQLVRRGRMTERVRVGVLESDGCIVEAGRFVGEWPNGKALDIGSRENPEPQLGRDVSLLRFAPKRFFSVV